MKLLSHGASGSNELQVVTDDTWVLDLEDIEKTTSRLLQRMRVRDREFKSSKNSFKKGDVLYGKLRPYLDKVIVADEDGVCTTEIVPIRVYLDITPQYLRFALKRPDFLEYVNGKTYGVKMPRLGTKDACMALFPLPPLAEQRRIVAKVESLFAQTRALEAKLRQAQADLVTVNRAALHRLSVAADADAFAAAWATVRDAFDLLYDDPRNVAELRQAILQLAVQGKLVPQDPADEPASELLKCIRAEKRRLVKEGKLSAEEFTEIEVDTVPHVPIGLVCDVKGGIQKSNDRQPGQNPRRYITVAHVQRGRIDTGDPRYFEVSDEELERWRLIPGDILVVEGNGSADHIGRAAIFMGEIEDCVHQNHVIRVRPNSAFVIPKYLNLYLNSPLGREHILERSRTTSGLYNLSVGRIKTLEIPLPSLAEQRRIVAKVDQLMRQCDALESGLARAEEGQRRALTAAALHGAFG